ncbi:type II toxin-antitoxin system RelE/ParE family toxin [Bradyrhizobium sp. CCBAU 53351]|uniref:type II toxin-antitoxin system RelE/ParE family toxin n=1 Tax=Bradyrhizobium sp. CCBAU 53351 TaxID=1325114 RepID=UPI001FEDBEC1|nr:type II toxin-antitoxin system RelE/ParE family toxin [Bradyrhizobium sp. CCBAU 53351]
MRATDTLIDRIDATFDMLAETPFAARDRSELRAELRSFPVGNYLVFHVPTPDGVEVVRVMHGRQDIGADDMQ